jgi:hypothetical protein
MIVCLRVDGVMYTDARPLLFKESVNLLQHNERRSVVRAEMFELTVTNTGDRGRLGTFTGPLFDAVIETEQHTTKVTYLVEDWAIEAEVTSRN